MQREDALISVLVVNVDHYMTKICIGSDLENVGLQPLQQLRPVIRVFGSTALGQRACVHIHGILPYVYFRPENLHHAAFDTYAKLLRILPVLEKSLEDLLHARRQMASRERDSRRRKHIHSMDIVKKKSIYGMWIEEVLFVKVYLNDPGDKLRLAAVLNDGALAGVTMQAYEAHIPYLLQFTSDFNISPMNWLHLKNAKFRLPLPVSIDGNADAIDVESGQPNEVQQLTPHIPAEGSLPLDQFDSPIFKFLSATMPSPVKSSSLKRLRSEQPSLTLFIQHSVPKAQTWSTPAMSQTLLTASSRAESVIVPANQVESKQELSEEHRLEVQAILDGIANGDLVWSQYENAPAQPVEEFKQAQAESEYKATNAGLQKDSTCELELDTHLEYILNATMIKAEFGAELWEEEKLRCAKLGQEMDAKPQFRFNQTMQRSVQQKELEYFDRFENLLEKGKALRTTSKAMQKRHGPFPATLSQYTTSEDRMESQNESILPGDAAANQQHLSNMDEWAQDIIQQTQKDAQLQQELLQEYCKDPDTVLEEYAKSQISQSVLRGAAAHASASRSEEEDDDENSFASIQRETEAILSITQVDVDTLEQTHMAMDIERVENVGSSQYDESPLLDPRSFHEVASEGGDLWTYLTPDEPLPAKPACSYPSPIINAASMLGEVVDVHNPNDRDQFDYVDGIAGVDHPTLLQSIIATEKPPLPLRKRGPDAQKLTSVFSKKGKFGNSPIPDAASQISTPSALSNGVERTNNADSGIGDSERKKLRKNVSFAAPKFDIQEESSSLASVMPSSPPVPSSEVVISLQPMQNTPSSADGSEACAIKNSTIHSTIAKLAATAESPFSLAPNRHHWLLPNFPSPAASNLNQLDVFGVPLVLNQFAHFSNEEDAAIEQQGKAAAQNSSNYAHYQAQAHFLKYKYDLPLFNGGRYLIREESSSEPALHHSPSTFDCAGSIVSRLRCLLPSFSAPKLAKETCNIFKADVRQEADGPASWMKSQIGSPTQTPEATPFNPGTDMHQIGCGARTGDNADRMTRHMVLSMELFCCTRQNLLPNPKHDPIQCIVWIVDDMLRNASTEHLNRFGGIICVLQEKTVKAAARSPEPNPDGAPQSATSPETDCLAVKVAKEQMKMQLRTAEVPTDAAIEVVVNEHELFSHFLAVVKDLDPDFLVGYENTSQSFGYFIKRGAVLNMNCLQLLSRLPSEKPSFRNEMGSSSGREESVEPGEVGIFIKGRTFLNNWQIMTSEVKLADCCLQHVVETVLQQTMPYFSAKQQTHWFATGRAHCTVSYVYSLAMANLLLLDKLDMFRKISECARLYGIDFYSVIHRGSQYRVEAALLYKAHTNGYLLLSPSKDKVAGQAPMEAIPLVLEPKSQFFTDPVIVLDFQSLYPSIMIAFNLCFTTIMGKLRTGVVSENLSDSDTTGKLGVMSYPESNTAVNTTLHLSSKQLNPLAKKTKRTSNESEVLDIEYDGKAPYVSPNGSVFVGRAVRKGILPSMLQEMLDTRVMVKGAMKRAVGNKQKVLSKVLDARQLAIKLLSNVTYGYTAAGFSGRMPMAELADAIVQTGRTLLEHTFHTINTHPTWQAKVVYGDTDSVFVHLPNRSLAQAFVIGEEIAQHITSCTPQHLILKFEKVYYPCLLVTKKRYVGQCYENKKNLSETHLDAKGIEMIRKDQCRAAMKIQEKALRILFQSRDLSMVKQYLIIQWTTLLQDHYKLLLHDFVFYKEVRFGHYNSVHSQPPGAIVATKAVLLDEMAVPPYNWRVPYLVVYGSPGTQLKYLVYDPKEVMRRGSNLRCNFLYYILKCINPALDRVLSLCGVNVNMWFKSMPRPKTRIRHMNYDLPLDNSVQVDLTIEPDSQSKAGKLFPRPNQLAKRSAVQTLMDQFTTQGLCEVCQQEDALPRKLLCSTCMSVDNAMESFTFLTLRCNQARLQDQQYQEQCRKCAQYNRKNQTELFMRNELIAVEACESLACEVFHERCRLTLRLEDYTSAVRDIEDADV